MFQKTTTITTLYIILVIFSPQMITVSSMAVPLHSGLMLYQVFQIILAIFDGIDTLTGSHVTGAFSWTYHLVANGTKIVTGTVPLSALAFLAYKLPTAVQKISKKLGIKIKDIPKIVFNRPDRPKIKRWRRV